jgi:uncharacterized protein YdhG (YjbR/CyaY superfamily)
LVGWGKVLSKPTISVAENSLCSSVRTISLPALVRQTVKTLKKRFDTIDEYIATFPRNVQDILEELRQTIQNSAPDAKETISYQMPAFKLNGILVWFAAFKNHIGFYPKTSAIEAFKEELSHYETSKGTVRFPINEPIPFDLIRKIVRYRVKENLDKK